MNPLIDWIVRQAERAGASPANALLAGDLIGVVIVVILAWLGNYIAKRIILEVVNTVVKRTRFEWDDVLVESGVFTRLSHLVPAIIINTFGDDVLGATPEVAKFVDAAVSVYLIFIWLGVFYALLDAIQRGIARRGSDKGMPVKGFMQAIKLVATVCSIVFVLALLLNKSPIYIFSGLGAATAVLLLVFRDAILGFVAGIMISVNDIARVGDWIEMPKAGADGDVIDVSLTTVKVRNWDKTITSIPAYDLISEPFKNWRGMKETGGRRIKRALYLDMGSIRFADEEQLERWSKIGHVREHLARKRKEIAEDNAKLGDEANVLGNGRRLTNVGTFRAYCVSYLKSHPHISKDLTFLVRQLAPTEHGLPIEIYVFVTDTNWAFYEGVQSDVFDHLLSVVKVFDLRIFQTPSGHDVQSAVHRLVDEASKSARPGD